MTLRKGTNMLMRGFGFSIMLFILMSPFGAQSFAQSQPYVTQYLSEFEVWCLKEVNGVPIKREVRILLNPDPIGDPNAFSFGTVRLVGGDDRNKTNCRGEKYDYAEVNIDMNWTGFHPDLGQVDHSHNYAYWNDYYRDYDPPASCDYSQNCHGYAFDVGDWPRGIGAAVILNLNPTVGDGPPCYQWCTEKDATIASFPIAHSIKVEGTECDLVVLPGGGGGESDIGNFHPNFSFNLNSTKFYCATTLPLWIFSTILEQDPIPGDPVIKKDEKIVLSSEQNRESGTYTQISSCEEVKTLDLNLAHSRAGIQSLYLGITYEGFPFSLYRPYHGN